MARALTEKEKEYEVRFMTTPLLWPLLFLPVKRYTGKDAPQAGFILTSEEQAVPTVYLKNVVALSLEQEDGKPVALEDIPTQTYASFEALVDDGWLVD